MLGLVVLFVLFETAAGGGSNAGSPPKQVAKQEDSKAEDRKYDDVATVKYVVEGDTIRIVPAIDGANEVRLIGVDTPEAGEAKTGDQPYGERASRFTESALDGKKVGLVFDAERKDRRGRLLAYVYPMGDGMFNEYLLRKGYAQVYNVRPDDAHRREFVGEQRQAKAEASKRARPRHLGTARGSAVRIGKPRQWYRRGFARVQGQAQPRPETRLQTETRA
jgi:micrococcal nuclease